MIRFLLRHMESVPNPAFSKRELVAISPAQFENMKRRKILKYFRSANDDDWETIRWPRCQHGCHLTVERHGERYEAFCLDHSEEGVIYVEEDDLIRYALSPTALLDEFRAANQMDGELSPIDRRSYHMGYKRYASCRVDFIFISDMGPDKLVRLIGLKHVCPDAETAVMLTPVSRINDVLLEGRLRQERIVQVDVSSNMNPTTLEIPFEGFLNGLLEAAPRSTSQHPVLTKKQAEDYKRFDYRFYNTVHIPGFMPIKRSNLIEVGETELAIPDYLFLLLLRLVLELKLDKGGWIVRKTLKEEGIITAEENLQIFSNLRNALQGGLQGKDAKEFIQADKSKRHCLSTHPDFVTYERDKLLEHPILDVRGIAEKLP